MQRLGLCCLFKREPIRFRTTTAAYIQRLATKGENPLHYISEIIFENCLNLLKAVNFCAEHGIGSFRITSRLFPLYTHPECGYEIDDLENRVSILKKLRLVKKLAQEKNIRLTFHPDQFVVLSSPSEDVVKKSIQELEYHGFMSRLVGADVINLHAGGGYGNKHQALLRFKQNFKSLSHTVQERLTLENDDKVYSPVDILPLCQELKIPFVYDVHHHRCLKDSLSIEQASEHAIKTWNREPLFHISSPKDRDSPHLHADFIDPKDMPACWKKIDPLTIEVEAKAKEVAVMQLRKALVKLGSNSGGTFNLYPTRES